MAGVKSRFLDRFPLLFIGTDMIPSPEDKTSQEANMDVKTEYPKVNRLNFMDSVILNVFLDEKTLDCKLFQSVTADEDCDEYLKSTYNIG